MVNDDRDAGAPGTPGTPDWHALARYLAGESDPAERSRIERELAANRAQAALVAALDETLRAPVPAALSPAEVDRALAAVMMRRDQGAQVIRPKGLWRPGAPWRAAAAILVV